MSGVYVKGFQLPEKNDLYYVKVECEPGKNPAATIWRKDVLGPMSFGVFECIPVPDHGRLGDLDEFEVIGYQGIPEGYFDTFDDGVLWLSERIDDAPTIIPASGKDINAPTKEE